jgi:multicomponent Na+:H+ antiporter subunit A
VGYGIALIFGLYAAPDLAMTQFATETLSLIVMVLVLTRMPGRGVMAGKGGRARDAVVALAAGCLSALLVLLARSGSAGSRLSAYFIENSEPRGHGRNVVNVILVDFRALDTLGEITVVSVAALGAYSLLKMRPEAPG